MPETTAEETEILYVALREKAPNIALSVIARKIQSVLFKRRKKLFSMTVGKPDPFKNETIAAIFESSLYFLIFTRSRGIERGEPYLVSKTEVLSMVEFE